MQQLTANSNSMAKNPNTEAKNWIMMPYNLSHKMRNKNLKSHKRKEMILRHKTTRQGKTTDKQAIQWNTTKNTHNIHQRDPKHRTKNTKQIKGKYMIESLLKLPRELGIRPVSWLLARNLCRQSRLQWGVRELSRFVKCSCNI